MARNKDEGEPAKELTAKQKRELRAREAAEAKAAGKPTSEETERLNQAAITRPDAVADAHGKIEKPSKAGGKVVVGCKVGVAYIDLQLCQETKVWENTQTGPREVKKFERTGNVVRIRGTAYPRGTPPEGFPDKPMIVDGAALTFGVDEHFWNEWKKQNHLNPLVVNSMVFAHVNIDYVKGVAQEHSAEKSGLDPVNPKGDKRMPRSTRSDVSNIETEETRAAKMNRAAQGG
jgi:hypothetical protein